MENWKYFTPQPSLGQTVDETRHDIFKDPAEAGETAEAGLEEEKLSEVKVGAVEEVPSLGCLRSNSVLSLRSSATTESLSPRQGSGQPARKMSHRGPGAASKKCELLQDKPILPNKNVGSKLKALLSEKEEKLKGREPRTRKPNKWEAVMNKIEQGKQSVKPVTRTRKVRSKIFTNLVTFTVTTTTTSSTSTTSRSSTTTPTPGDSLPLQATSR